MRVLDAAATARLLPYPALIGSIREAFAGATEAPERSHHPIDRAPGSPVTLLLMPAWQAGGPIGIKIATVAPDNRNRGLPAIAAVYLLLDGETGQAQLMLDGATLTARRTAATSALASSFLWPGDCGLHLIVGAGAVAAELAQAHRAIRQVASTRIWARRPEQAHRLVESLRREGVPAEVSTDLAVDCRRADIISAATLAQEPLIRGAHLGSRVHLDLVGSYLPTLREADDDALRGAAIYVDNPIGALRESGELAIPLQRKVIALTDIRGSLNDLVAGRARGRSDDSPKTVFKSVGTAISDYGAALCARTELTRGSA